MNDANDRKSNAALLEEIRATQLEQVELAEKLNAAYTKHMEKYEEYVLEYNGKFEKWAKVDTVRLIISIVFVVCLTANCILLTLIWQRL